MTEILDKNKKPRMNQGFQFEFPSRLRLARVAKTRACMSERHPS